VVDGMPMGEGDRIVDAADLGPVARDRAAEDAREAQLGDEQGQAHPNRGHRGDQRDRCVAEAQQHAVAREALARCPYPLSHYEEHFD
jgi:hypothetical protein